MSQENVDAVRRAYEASHRRDVESLRSFAAPTFRCYDRPDRPDRGTYRGPDGFVRLLEDDLEVFDNYRTEPELFVDAGDGVVVRVRQVGRGRSSGMSVEERIAHLWRLQDGRATELRIYSTMSQALEAAGLSE